MPEKDDKKMTMMKDAHGVGVIRGWRRLENLRQDSGQETPSMITIRKPRKNSNSKVTPSKGGEDGLRNVVKTISRKSAKKKETKVRTIIDFFEKKGGKSNTSKKTDNKLFATLDKSVTSAPPSANRNAAAIKSASKQTAATGDNQWRMKYRSHDTTHGGRP